MLDWVDACLLIDTGAGDGSHELLCAQAGARALPSRWRWNDDFAAARNHALDEAERSGAGWALTLDPDERLQVEGADLRRFLAATDAGCIMLPDDSGSYFKERLFRLPCPVRFVGPVHEAFAGYRVGIARYDRGSFHELPKSAAELERKTKRDVAVLQRHTATVRDDPRWFYYLGDGLQRLGRSDEAITAYTRCWELRGWAEEAAWACYRAAECELARADHEAAIEWCARGLARAPGTPELPWLAAVSAWRAGRPADAVAWARMAEAVGRAAGCGDLFARIGFRHAPAEFEGPYDVLRYALAALGDREGAELAEQQYRGALALRRSGSRAATGTISG